MTKANELLPCPFCGYPPKYQAGWIACRRCEVWVEGSGVTWHSLVTLQQRAEEAEAERDLDFGVLRRANVTRCEQAFHPLAHWNIMEWGNACAGEVGEACNVAKKLHRQENSKLYMETLPQNEACKEDLADELADLVIYADLWAARVNIDLGEAIRQKFDRVSKKMGSNVFLKGDQAAPSPAANSTPDSEGHDD